MSYPGIDAAAREAGRVMRNIVVVGAGKIGVVISDLLVSCGDYRVTLADKSLEQLRRAGNSAGVALHQVNTEDGVALQELLGGKDAVLSAAPFHSTIAIARAAREAGVHYLDLTEDVASTREVRRLADGADKAFVPQCGLAPGFVSILAHDMTREFDEVDAVRLRVGALPQYPSNALNYNLTWSTDGVINEYCEPCDAIVEGKHRQVPALEEREEFSLDGITYEAFNTSGGLGTLCETLEGRVRTLNYRTIRYPGHCAIMKALLNDLRLRERRDLLRDILENALPTTLQDVVVVFVTVTGRKDGRFIQKTYANKVYSRTIAGTLRSAIQVTTAAGICAVLDLLMTGAIPDRGFLRQEQIPLAAFLSNRFGCLYDPSRPTGLAAAA